MNNENCNTLDNECNTGWYGAQCVDIFMWQDINDECEVELSCQCYEANCKLLIIGQPLNNVYWYNKCNCTNDNS